VCQGYMSDEISYLQTSRVADMYNVSMTREQFTPLGDRSVGRARPPRRREPRYFNTKNKKREFRMQVFRVGHFTKARSLRTLHGAQVQIRRDVILTCPTLFYRSSVWGGESDRREAFFWRVSSGRGVVENNCYLRKNGRYQASSFELQAQVRPARIMWCP
jgi:hypothetical protein